MYKAGGRIPTEAELKRVYQLGERCGDLKEAYFYNPFTGERMARVVFFEPIKTAIEIWRR